MVGSCPWVPIESGVCKAFRYHIFRCADCAGEIVLVNGKSNEFECPLRDATIDIIGLKRVVMSAVEEARSEYQ